MVAELFSNALKRAMERKLSVVELLGACGNIQAAGETALVAALYRTWIEHNPDDRLLYAMHFNYAVVLSGMGDLAGARAALETAIKINPDFYPPYINLGQVLEKQGASGNGVNTWYALVNRLHTVTGDNVEFKTTALKQIARVLERSLIDPKAEEALALSLHLNPNQSDALQHWISLRQRQCKWPVMKPWANVSRKHLVNGISALSLGAYTDDPLLQLGNAYRYCKNQIGPQKVSFAGTHAALKAAPAPRLRIGYVSSDLREHAIGFLTSELYELHDRAKVEVFAYYCGIDAPDGIKTRIKSTVDHWIDINPMSDEQAAQRIVDDGIHILVDVNGYTNSARTKLFAMRPAPVIVNWLGFPGSMGSPHHDYIIADDFIIPPAFEIYYSERVKRIPCYQPNDRKRVISTRVPTRQEAELPEDAVVYCCFNGVHKITPFTWRRWMTILKEVPGSVLWLLDGTEGTNGRLKELMTGHGVAPERVVFARKKINPEHLARYPLADLFLDTSPYGAHTTSSDAMWMGVPVLTLVGRSFPARVCGSLVASAGLPELICETPDAYVAKAIELGKDKAKRDALRRKLAEKRDSCVLFDTPLLASSLERVYREMWDECVAGKIKRPDLANLEIYNDIGVEIDDDDVELLTVPDYDDLYRRKLAEKDSFYFLTSDSRLWPAKTV